MSRINDDDVFISIKWPYSNPPKLGELYMAGGQAYRILGFRPADLPSYARKEISLHLEPWR